MSISEAATHVDPFNPDPATTEKYAFAFAATIIGAIGPEAHNLVLEMETATIGMSQGSLAIAEVFIETIKQTLSTHQVPLPSN